MEEHTLSGEGWDGNLSGGWMSISLIIGAEKYFLSGDMAPFNRDIIIKWVALLNKEILISRGWEGILSEGMWIDTYLARGNGRMHLTSGNKRMLLTTENRRILLTSGNRRMPLTSGNKRMPLNRGI